ncbi:MAG: ABC transporter ATP-binding protein [Planctomycetes bacterium]|nr:ABC transporter ATP-binding protein [Planctomycetota bacterium]
MSAEAPRPAIRCSGLTLRYPGKEVLRGIDLEVAPGTVFGYLGANGAGKTTTVKILTGMLDLFGGEVEVAGIDVAAAPREVKRRIGYVPESAVLYDGLTAFEFVQLVGRLHGLDEDLIEARTVELLHVFGLGERAHNRLSTYSKGMKQKVMFCAALLHDPEVLFLDEPLSGLDVDSTIFIKELLRRLADEGRTIFYCSHMMDVVERVCDRIVILDQGRIAADGTFEELAHRSNEGSLEKLFSKLTGAGAPDERIQLLMDALALTPREARDGA